jgi:pimeloyl-ACP methyl ester carboxylesterase
VIREILLAAIDVGAFRLLIRRAMFHKEKLTEALMADFLAPLATPEGRKAFVHLARCLDNANLMEIAPDLERLRLPTTVVWGLGDVFLAFAIAERLVADIPGARLVTIPTAGHMAMLDEPDLVAAALREHLDAAGG